jgi:hypothetical protein
MMLHDLQKSEDGQTLVLAAVFGVVVALCVLWTVNVGRAVYDKVQLQNAADEAAYSQAAVEARVMNYTAYTNRAMVVHYASVMAATSYLTWVHFMYGGLKPVLNSLKLLQEVGIGEVAVVIDEVLQTLVAVLDTAVAALVPLLSAANLMLWSIQEGAWAAVYAKLLLAPTAWPEAHGGDTPKNAYQPIWPNVIPALNATTFAQTRGKLTLPQDVAQSAKMLVDSKDPDVQLARMQLVEIANSARQPWVAHGGDPSISPLGRHWKWKLSFGIGQLELGNVSRTELGAFAPGTSGVANVANQLSQIWSGERLQGRADLSLGLFSLSGKIDFLTFAAMDQAFAAKGSYFNYWAPGVVAKTLLAATMPGFGAALAVGGGAPLPTPDQRVFFLSPYVSFAPRAKSTPGFGPTGSLGNFAQPDVVVGLAKEGVDYNREPAGIAVGKKFSWNGKASIDLGYTDADWPKIIGKGDLALLHKGLNAFAAAQVYYHRPGEWREQPNLFNPLWGARLMPIAESNVYAKLGLSKVPLLQKYLSH